MFLRRSFFIGFRHAIEIADNRHSLQRFFIGQGHITKAVEHIRKSGRFRVRHLVLAWTALDAIVSSMAFFIGFFLCFKAYFVVGLWQECHNLIAVLSQSFFQVFKGRIHLVRLFLQKHVASIKTQLNVWLSNLRAVFTASSTPFSDSRPLIRDRVVPPLTQKYSRLPHHRFAAPSRISESKTLDLSRMAVYPPPYSSLCTVWHRNVRDLALFFSLSVDLGEHVQTFHTVFWFFEIRSFSPKHDPWR